MNTWLLHVGMARCAQPNSFKNKFDGMTQPVDLLLVQHTKN